MIRVIDQYKDYEEFDKFIEINRLKSQLAERDKTITQLKSQNSKLHNFIQTIIKILKEHNHIKLANFIENQYQKILKPKQKELER